MHPSSQEVASALLRAGAVALRPAEPFRLASGLLAPVYCDNRLLLGDVAARRVVVAALAERLRGLGGVQLVAGPATGGIAWAAWASEALGLGMAYVRSEAKGHGAGRMIEGGAVAGLSVALVEDAVSTGGSSLRAVAALREAGARVEHCVCIYWSQLRAATDAFAAAGVTLEALAPLDIILEVAVSEGRISAEQRGAVEEWARDPQGWTVSSAS